MQTNSVLVIGDIILDIYTSGHTTRISPEAPVPVVAVKSEIFVLGGAANVANNLAALGSDVCLVLPESESDSAGTEIKRLLAQNNISSVAAECAGYKTTVKTRVVSDGQQIMRLDIDHSEDMSLDDSGRLLSMFRQVLPEYDMVVLSDYNKGVFTYAMCRGVIRACNKSGTPVIVDPKGKDWEKYTGASLITPNLKEFSEYRDSDIPNNDKAVAWECKCVYPNKNLLITRAHKGMTLKYNDEITHFPCRTKKVFDVTGAGDTVVAVVAAFFGRKKLTEVVEIANKAAGVVVSKPGTATISQHELEDPISSKIMNLTSLIKQACLWAVNGESVVVANGCFDLLHRGHTHLIHKAAEFGDRLIIAVNSDRSVRALKGPDRPINNEYDRAYTVASMQGVDAVIIFDEDTPDKLLEVLTPDVLVKGGDHLLGGVLGSEFVGRVEIVDYLYGRSTTNLIDKARTTNG